MEGSLKRFVYRGLTLRVLVAALVIAAILSLAVVAGKRELVSESVVEETHNSIKVLLAQTRQRMRDTGVSAPHQAFRESLETFRELRLSRRYGSFVLARFYDTEGAPIAESVREEYGLLDEVKRHAGDSPTLFPGAGETPSEVVRLGGHPHVHLVYPIENLENRLVAYGEAYFAISDEALAGFRRDLLKSVLWVVLIVLVTSAILYPVILSLTGRLAEYSEKLLDSHLETVQILGSAIAKRDSDTSAHNFRVTVMAVRIAEVLGLEPEKIQRLIKGAFLHDVGKIGITDNILLKPARLDAEEFKVMKTHVNHGVDIVTRKEWLQEEKALRAHVEEGVKIVEQISWLDEAAQVVEGHHEKYDGSGYPRGLKGGEIPLVARIFAICDVFDALTCERPYKKPFSFEKSMAILEEGRGSHFDPKVLDAFNSLADGIYRDLANREDEGLKDDLEKVTRKYFQAGLESLSY